MKNRAAIAGLAALVVVVVAWFASGGPPPLQWEQGAEQGYRYHWRTLFERKGIETLTVDGTLHLRVFDVSTERVRVGLQFKPARVARQRIADVEWSALFGRRYYADFAPTGELLKLHAPADLAPGDVAVYQQALRAMQIVVPPAVSSSWTNQEQDHRGKHTATYSYDGGVTRVKSAYEDKGIRLTRSSLRCSYERGRSWLTSCKGGELAVMGTPKGRRLKQSHDIELGFDPDAVHDWADADPDAEIAAWAAAPGETLTFAERHKKDTLRARIGDIALPEYVASIFAACRGFHGSCVNRLIDYLRLHPEAAALVPGLLLNPDSTREERAMLVAALQSAQTKPAQYALMTIAMGEEFPDDSRVQAVVALGDALDPAPGVVDALWKLYQDERAGVAAKASDNAMLSLGRLARTLDDKNGDIVAHLHTELGAVSDPRRLSSVMYAAANSGDTAFVEPLIELASADTSRTRSAAVQALSICDHEAIEGLYMEVLASEKDIGVRNTLMKSLNTRKVSNDMVTRVCQALPTEENDIVRGEMYRFLLKHRKRPGVRTTLQAMLDTERSFENVNLISRALATRK